MQPLCGHLSCSHKPLLLLLPLLLLEALRGMGGCMYTVQMKHAGSALKVVSWGCF